MYPKKKKLEAIRCVREEGMPVALAAERAGVSRSALQNWLEGRYLEPPGRRKRPVYLSDESKAAAAAEVLAGAAADGLAARLSVSRAALMRWALMLKRGELPAAAGEPEELPDDPEALKEIIRDMRFRLDLAREVVAVVKKDPAADPAALTNREKAAVVDALRGAYSVTFLTSRLDIAESTYYSIRSRAGAPDRRAGLMDEVREAFEAGGRARGYRFVWARLRSRGRRVSEKVVRELMREGGMAVAHDRKRLRGYDSYRGEVGDRPPNVLYVEEEGRAPGHVFHAALPNEVWVTDVTEFRLPSGPKVYLSPVVDCFDGRVVSWGIGLHPTGAMAEAMLREACAALAPGEAPVLHTDGGGQYRTAGWKAACEEHGITRSMSRKGRSGDNARMEGFFGTLKNEFFHHRDREGVTAEEFIRRLDSFLRYYNDERPKESLGWLSTREYREALGFAV